MNKKILTLIILSLVYITACNKKRVINLIDPFNSVNFLIGKWSVNESDIIEKWDKKDKDYLRCIAYRNTIDSVYVGESAITKLQNKIYLLTTIHSKYGAKIKYYPLVENSSKMMIFKNDSIDFPKTYHFTFIDSNTFILSVEGSIDSFKTKKQIKNEFNMIRIKE